MNRYGALALIIATLAVVYFARWLAGRGRRPDPVDIPLEETERSRPEIMQLVSEDDTAPAVLSPPEWKPPKKAA